MRLVPVTRQFFRAPVGHVHDRWKRMWGLTLRLSLLVVLCALTPLADASLPDALWITGVYDGDGSDEVVEAATLHAAAIVIEIARPAEPLSLVGVLRPGNQSLPRSLALSPSASRSPPTG